MPTWHVWGTGSCKTGNFRAEESFRAELQVLFLPRTFGAPWTTADDRIAHHYRIPCLCASRLFQGQRLGRSCVLCILFPATMAAAHTAAKLNFQFRSPLLQAVKPCQGAKSAISPISSFPKRFSKAGSIRQCSQEARSAQVLRSELWGSKVSQPVGYAQKSARGCSMSVSTETAVSDELFADYKVSTAFLFPGQVWMHLTDLV